MRRSLSPPLHLARSVLTQVVLLLQVFQNLEEAYAWMETHGYPYAPVEDQFGIRIQTARTGGAGAVRIGAVHHREQQHHKQRAPCNQP